MIHNPNSIVESIVTDFKQAFGDNLSSVIMYGSAVTHEYDPKYSDINIICVIVDNTIPTLAKFLTTFKKWRHKGVSTPYFFTKEYINKSLDTYPIEFLDIQSAYRILFGEDVIGPLKITKEHLRLQCEREIKRISLHLRTSFINCDGNKKEIRTILILAIKQIMPLFKALITLNDRNIPNSKSEVIAAVEDLYSMGSSIFSEIFLGQHSSKEFTVSHYDKFTSAVDVLAKHLDNHG